MEDMDIDDYSRVSISFSKTSVLVM
ncbi:unnamed protein product [Priceomyces carsonii]|nr:unnamed protein product [Priceomyces carsonii]